MCRVFNSLLAVAAVGGIAGIAGFVKSSSAPSMEGAWQAVEVSLTGPGARTIRPLQSNLAIFTARYYSHIEIHADGPRPSVADPAKASAEELRQAWGPVVAEAGSYELSGGSFTTHPVVAKNPAAMAKGAFTSYAYRIAGDTLWLTMQRTERGPVPNPPTIKLTRVE